jgi:hypothetical protein
MAVILGVVISIKSLYAQNLIKEDSLGNPNAPITIYEFTFLFLWSLCSFS